MVKPRKVFTIPLPNSHFEKLWIFSFDSYNAILLIDVYVCVGVCLFEFAVTGVIKLQLEAGKATPAPPVGPALGAKGVNIMAFCKDYNARTADKMGYVIPVEITVFDVSSLSSSSLVLLNSGLLTC